jgi:hypothetical protein
MRRLIAMVALLALPAALCAQQQQGAPTKAAPPPSTSVSTTEALGAVRGRLLLLVESQEAHFADHSSYTKDLAALQLSGKGNAQSPVVLDVTHAGSRAWRATAWHRAHPNKTCVIFVGRPTDFSLPATKADRRQPTAAQAGQAICDEP